MQDLLQQHWDDVRVFLALQRAGSLGKAATRLGINISTTSRRLSALEAALGVRLFDRGREGLIATAAAEAVLPAAEAMESALARFARSASGVESVAEGVVRVSAAPGLIDTFVAPALVRLRAKHPRIHIELDASTRVLDLTRHEADLALRSVPPQGAQLVVTKLATARWLCVSSKAFAKKLGKVSSWDALPWLAWDRDLSTFPAARWLAKHAPKAEIVLRTSHFASQLVAARAGLGAVLVPKPYLRVHPLVPLLFLPTLAASEAELPTDDLWLVAHRSVRELPRVAAVWQFLVDELRPTTSSAAPRQRRA